VGTHYLINDACVLYRKSLVTAAIYRFEGQITSYVPDRGPCYRCLFPNPPTAIAPSCAEVGVLGVLPGVLGTLQATEAIKLALGLGVPLVGRLLTYDALELHFHELRFARDPDCAVCGERATISAPGDDQPRAVAAVDARQLAGQIAAGSAGTAGSSALQLIDVREPAEFIAGHIQGAINLPLGTIEREGLQLARPVGAASPSGLVFICRSGVRSARAIELAQRAGYLDVRHLDGGMRSWRALVDPAITVL
jgi:adenylyltransferase/sulfurtransferase